MGGSHYQNRTGIGTLLGHVSLYTSANSHYTWLSLQAICINGQEKSGQKQPKSSAITSEIDLVVLPH